MAADKSPLDQVVEVLIYAPVGLAVVAGQSIPELVSKGRERVSGQVALARFIGQYAVTKGERHARRRAEELGRALGLLPGAPPAPPPDPAPAAPGRRRPPGRPGAPHQASRAGQPRPEGRSTAALAIPAYDTLSASQVVQRLAGLSGEELEAVRDYEARTRGRRTILSRIAQLQSGPAA